MAEVERPGEGKVPKSPHTDNDTTSSDEKEKLLGGDANYDGDAHNLLKSIPYRHEIGLRWLVTGLCLGNFATNHAVSLPSAFAVRFYVGKDGRDKSDVGLLMTCSWGAELISLMLLLALHRLLRGKKRDLVVILGMFLLAGAALASAFVYDNFNVLLGIRVFEGAVIGIAFPYTLILAAESRERWAKFYRALVGGTVLALGRLGGMLGTTVGGVLYSKYGVPVVYFYGAAVCVIPLPVLVVGLSLTWDMKRCPYQDSDMESPIVLLVRLLGRPRVVAVLLTTAVTGALRAACMVLVPSELDGIESVDFIVLLLVIFAVGEILGNLFGSLALNWAKPLTLIVLGVNVLTPMVVVTTFMMKLVIALGILLFGIGFLLGVVMTAAYKDLDLKRRMIEGGHLLLDSEQVLVLYATVWIGGMLVGGAMSLIGIHGYVMILVNVALLVTSTMVMYVAWKQPKPRPWADKHV